MDKGTYIALGVGLIIFGLVVIDIGRQTMLAWVGYISLLFGVYYALTKPEQMENDEKQKRLEDESKNNLE